MKRRALLAAVAAAAGTTATAGCLNDPGSSDSTTSSTTTVATGEPVTEPSRTTNAGTVTDEATTNGETTTDGEATTDEEPTDDQETKTADAYRPDWEMSTEPAGTVTVGSRANVAFPDANRPRTVALWNDTGGRVDLGVVVERGDAAASGREFSLADGEWVRVELEEPGEYVVRAAVDGEDRWSREFYPSSFDCNSRFTQAALGPDGAMATRSGGTAQACRPPGVSGTTLDASDGECASDLEHEARVSFSDGAVTVDGRVRTPTPCYRLAVQDASYGDDGETLTVELAATAEDGACVECVGSVPYDATVDCHTAYPGRVVVAHVVDGERTVVSRTEGPS